MTLFMCIKCTVIFVMSTGLCRTARVERAQRLRQRCDTYTADDVEHMLYNCVEMDLSGIHCLYVDDLLRLTFFIQYPKELAAFVHDSCYACKE